MAKRTGGIVLTYELAMASGHDAGNMSMRKACRKRWSVEDWNVAALTTARLAQHLDPQLGEALRREFPELAR